VDDLSPSINPEGLFARCYEEKQRARKQREYLASRAKRYAAKRAARLAQVRGAVPRGSSTSTTVEH
jgi:hypothetical protein